MPQTIEIVKSVPITSVITDLENLLSEICDSAGLALNNSNFPALTISGTVSNSTLDAASLGGKPAVYYDITQHSINDLNDVDTSTVANGHILKWNSIEARWKTEMSINNLDDLLDVTITDPTNKEVLVYDYNLNKWINNTLSEAGIAAANHNHNTIYLGISATAVDSDKLDGQHGSFYQNADNLNAGTVPIARLTGTYNINISGNAVNSDKLDNQDGTYYLNWNNFTNKPTTYTPSAHGNSAHTSTFITASDVTYTNLNANGSVGTGSTQVARGNHTHSVWDVIIEDQQTAGTNGGTSTAGSWVTRTLNTLVYNNGSMASLSSNRFSLSAGTYCIDWDAPTGEVGKNKSRLYNYTAGSVVAYGQSSSNSSSSSGTAVVTISSSTSFQIEHYCETAVDNTGLGVATGSGTEVYTRVRIRKIA